MRRLHARMAKVTGSGHDAAAEVVLPKAICRDAGREWIALAGNPLGERKPAAPRWS